MQTKTIDSIFKKRPACLRYVWRITEQPSIIFRKKKFELFIKIMQPKEQDKVIDIGVAVENKLERGTNFFEIMYPYKKNLTALGLGSIDGSLEFKKIFPEVNLIIGNCLNIPFEDDYFDIAFSNAVLEHVGTRENQKKFISEIIRVSKRCFITTPNKWFPLELHSMLPIVHWLPDKFKYPIYKNTGNEFWADIKNLNLLSKKEFVSLFPKNGNFYLIKKGIFFLNHNLVAVYDKE
jgi:SAM-dependent methyltransferase